ncbi:ABC transporter permease [Rhabdothermincola salaria]|uniref:ABC transporter permease n=1 Tax=Rhabdothermincola salaria TaxID=2903142 RepID=UPI001E5DE7DC|nr:ABC transporter permease [Rhabdothermincola salaria]MCD9622310.1 ABC transporter permease [Rhabdothermincola salaria]
MLAGREIRRAKVRFGLLAGAVGLLVFLIMFQQALLGSLLKSFTGAIENQSAQVLVYSAEARKNVAGSVIPPPTQDAVEAVDGVGSSAPLGEATLTVAAGGEQVDASVFGFELGGPGEPTRLTDGRLPTGPTEVVASGEDADDGFALGDEVTSVSGDVVLTVVGLTEESRFSVAPTLWVTFDGYEALRRAANPDAQGVLPSLVALIPADGVSPSELAGRINAQVPDVEALTRAEAVSEAPGVSAVNTSFQLILGLAFVVVALVIGFFFLILTVQKLDSLTLLRAVGAPTGYLVRALLTQIAFVVGGGLVVGVALTVLAVRGASAGLPISLDPVTLGLLAVGVLVLAALGSVVTLVRVARIDPAGVVSRQNLGGLS